MPPLEGFIRLHRNSANLKRGIIRDYECACFEILQENLTTKFFYRSKLINTVLHEALQYLQLLRMTITVKKTDFLSDVVSIFQFGAYVGTDKWVPTFIIRC